MVFQLQHVFPEYSGLIFFRMDCLDLLAVQETLKSLLQHHSSKASILRNSAFFLVQLSHPCIHTISLTRWPFVGKVMSLLFNMLSRLVIAFLPRSKPLSSSPLGFDCGSLSFLLASLLSPCLLLPFPCTLFSHTPELHEWVCALEAEQCKRCHLQRCFLSECHGLTSGSCYSCVNEMSEMNFTV